MHVIKAKDKNVVGLRGSALHVYKNYKHPLIMAEVGVCTGVNAFHMLSHMRISMLYLVDPYLPYVGGMTVDTHLQEYHDATYAKTFVRLVPYHRQVSFVTRTSIFASKLFPENLFHYVYIDGNHSYEFVKEDCKAWWPKVKQGYVMGGHDYHEKYSNGVKKAVDEFVSENKLKLTVFKDSDWLIKKED